MQKSGASKIISTLSMVKVDNNIFFHELYGNRIFRYSLKEEMLMCVCRSSDISEYKLEYLGIACYMQKIYFFPYYAKKICIYDIQSGLIKYEESKYQYITKAISCEGRIFFWGDDQNYIVCFDVEKGSQKEIKMPKEIHINARSSAGIEANGKLYIPVKKGGMLLTVDILTLDVQLIVVTDTNMVFETVDFDGTDIWLSGTEKKIIRWSLEKQEKEEYLLESLENREMEMPWDAYFYTSRVFGEYIYFSPFKAKQLIRLHIKSGEIEKILSMRENEITMVLEDWENYLYFSCKNVKSGMARMDCLIDGSGFIRKEKILLGKSECNLLDYEHNMESLKDFISKIKGEYDEENYFKRG